MSKYKNILEISKCYQLNMNVNIVNKIYHDKYGKKDATSSVSVA